MTKRPCNTCGRVTNATRCPTCERVHEQRRGTPAQRGYDGLHYAARRSLAAMLPAECGYQGVDPQCPGTLLLAGGRWVAAHVVDGDPSQGWMHAHPACNERAKVRVAR